MKKSLLTLAIVLLAVAAQAQIKIHSDGRVSLGTLSNNYGVQVYPADYTSFRSPHTDVGSWVEISLSDVTYQKHWIVKNLNATSNSHTFYVYTNGDVHSRGSYRMADPSLMSSDCNVTNAGAVLDSITGIWYYPTDESEAQQTSERHVGISAEQVKRVLPEAVTSDEEGLLYLDYEALTVFLVEAVKEQRQEIIELRKTLEENGLMKPQ